MQHYNFKRRGAGGGALVASIVVVHAPGVFKLHFRTKNLRRLNILFMRFMCVIKKFAVSSFMLGAKNMKSVIVDHTPIRTLVA